MTDKSTKIKEDSKNMVPGHIMMESAIVAVCFLAAKSDSHRHLFASDYEWLVFPAIKLRQFLLLRNKKNEPLAFVSWALVNDEVEQRLLKGTIKLKPSEWKSGNKIYLIDIISPFVPEIDIIKQLDNFKDSEARVLLPKKDGPGFESKILSSFLSEAKSPEIHNTKKPKTN